MQQFGTSAFNTVVRWHKLGEVENECTSHKFILFAISMPKISTVGGNLTKFWQNNFEKFILYMVYNWLSLLRASARMLMN